jgi:large subunit ribosomal protein L19
MAIAFDYKGTKVHSGDTVRVHYKIIEKDVVAGKTKKEKHEEQKERFQVFEGMVIAISGKAENQHFIVRRIGVGNIGIERIIPVASPWIGKIEVKKRGDVRRAKLYYLRHKTSKEIARIAASQVSVPAVVPEKVKEAVKAAPVPEKTANAPQTAPQG